MADNFISFSRFTASPSNIANFGSTAEEIKSVKGTPNANPMASPFVSPAPAMNLLALDGAGSDLQRLSQPTQPTVDPYNGAQPTIASNRNVLAKLGSGVLPQLEQEVSKSSRDAETKGLMVDSFRRLRAMGDFLGQLNSMSEAVQVRQIAATRS